MKIVFYLILIVNILHLIDSTILQSEITENLILKQENSPYVSNENVVVHKTSKLIIEPGCELRFAKGKQLIVYGTLEARGTELNRIKFTKLNDNDLELFNQTNTNNKNNKKKFFDENKFRLVEGETVMDGKLQIYFNSKWHYVCSTQLNWTEIDVNVTCKSLGFSNGTFYNYQPSNNLTSHMKMFMPRCTGKEKDLFECAGTIDPELGLSVCDKQNIVGLVCEGFDNQISSANDNWGGIVFQKYAPYKKVQQFTSVFYNISQSILEYVDIKYAGLYPNTNRFKPNYEFQPGSAITVFQYAPQFNNILIEYSIGNGLNYSNIEAPGSVHNSIFRYNRGHGIVAKTRFGNLNITNTISHDNMGDGLKYHFNNTIWTQQEQEEYFVNRYIEYCDSQNPLSYPAYYRYKNPNYVRECSKTFSTESDMRITLHFQKVNIKSKYSTYWIEVYDGQTDKNSLIANYTFINGKTPEAIYSRSNYMFVKIRFKCNLASNRKLQPVEIEQLRLKQKWSQMQSDQLEYEKSLYKYNPPIDKDLKPDIPFQDYSNLANFKQINLNQLTFQEQQQNLLLFKQQQKEQDLKLNEILLQKQTDLEQSRIACPYTQYDDITMYAMIGDSKSPDLLIQNSHFFNNSQNGINATNLHSLVQINETVLNNNHLNGLHVQAGAGDVSLSHSSIESNSMNGINITYAGGLKEFNHTKIYNNGLYGLVVNFDVQQEFDNIFQNTTLNGSIIEYNNLAGVYISSYCNQSNVTINSTTIRNNQEDGIVIDSCKSAWYYLEEQDRWNSGYKKFLNKTIKFLHLNISWNLFESNRLNGLKIKSIQNMIGMITNNTFLGHKKGCLLITANHSLTSLNRNVSLMIQNNLFLNNTGRYVLNVDLNNLADERIQSINITFNRFEYNRIFDAYQAFNSRSSISAVVVVSSSNIRLNQNWFNNPSSKIQIGTHLSNFTTKINASFNWFNKLEPVYDLHYFMSYKDKCNQQWLKVRDGIFDNSNRSNLAQIIYWPFSCNERLWLHESSNDLPPPVNFDLYATESFGGVYDIGDSILPSNRYTVVNDILIKPGAKLTIKSGSELNFLNGVGILVLGQLNIEGHLSSLIKFTLANSYFNPRIKIRSVDNINKTNSNNTFNSSSISKNSTKIFRNFLPTFSISLVDGRNSLEGRLRLEINGKYGTVCNRGWSIQNSKLVCQQMGLILDPNFYLYSRWLVNDHRQHEAILMSEVQCDDLDTSLFECRHTRQYDHTCTHQDDVWIKCLKPSWAGIRYGLSSQPSSIKYAIFEHTGQYDYSSSKLSPALQIDFLQHDLSNLTFQHNQHTSLEILFNQPFRKSALNNLNFVSNNGIGLMTRTSYIRINQLYAQNQQFQSALEYNPFLSADELNSVRLYSSQPKRGFDVRKELTRLKDNTWFIGSEQFVLLYTDTEHDFGPVELNIQIKTDNNRVLVVDLIDFNTNFEQEQVLFCERLCQHAYSDSNSRQWNLSMPESTIFFPINTSYSVLHINYNVSSLKSGRLMFLVYSVKAPEQVYDYKNPSFFYLKNIMPENVLRIHNSTFVNNRHSIVIRNYDYTLDMFGNLRKRYNYSNIIISNCSFHFNEQVFWINTEPVLPNINQRVNNLTFHVMNSLYESNKDDLLISESGYQMFDLVPSIKLGPLGKLNITFEDCIIKNNLGGIRALYRYHEYSNTIYHYEIRNNKFEDNIQSNIKILLPRLYRFAAKNHYENQTHTLNIRNNEFRSNRLFELSIDGYYAQINITKNLFTENNCRFGLIKLSGTEKDFFIYNNKIENNEANFILDLEAKSHADNELDIQSLVVENEIQKNTKPLNPNKNRNEASLFILNSPSSYTIAVRGIQNCSINKNILENDKFDYELVGALNTNTLNSTIDATSNWWGTNEPSLIKSRIFDIHEWNNHALVSFVPYYSSKIDFSLSKRQPVLSVYQNLNENVLGGLIVQDLILIKTPQPYQIRADLTIMPGATLYINAGVEMEFYPNVGILVLGDLKASGTAENYIKMRPIKNSNNRIPFYSSFDQKQENTQTQFGSNFYTNFDYRDSNYINSNRIRLFDGLNVNEGFIQIYNTSLRAWSFVCDDQFTLASASIVCKQMIKEYRNPLVKSLYYYMAPNAQPAIWNQSFICQGGEKSLSECDTLANFHTDQCRAKGEYTYLICGSFNLDQDQYEHSWGGIRFAQPYFETYSTLSSGFSDKPYIKTDFQQQQQDYSFMYYVDLIGAGRLHNEPSPSVQLVSRTPLISNCNIKNSTYHGLEFLQSKSTAMFNRLKIENSLGYGLNSLQLNVQTTDQKSSFKIINKNTLSNQNIFSMIDLCDPHKYYDLDQRILVYYKYSNLARDCVKIFRTRLSQTNIGVLGQIGLRFLQFMLVNSSIQNDTIEIYNGALFKQDYLMTKLSNSSLVEDLERFYLSKTDSLSLFMRASPGTEYYGFIAEVLVYPSAQYLQTDTYLELSDSELKSNLLGALSLVTAGERNPNLYLVRNRFVQNGLELFNSTSLPIVDIVLQNTPKFYFGNNFISNNYGGVSLRLHSGSGVLITNTVVYNNLFIGNKNDSVLSTRGGLHLPYNEILIDKNVFLENETPRTDVSLVSGLLSKFTCNQFVYNKGARILYTQGFENVSTPKSQDISFNLLRDNYAYGIINDLEDPNRFRSTMVAASLKQVYYSNYLFNIHNDFELTALTDPLTLQFILNYYTTSTLAPFKLDDKINPKFIDKSPYIEDYLSDNYYEYTTKKYDLNKLAGMVAYTGSINASNNYWSTIVDSEIRARIRDKYDNQTLFEVNYSPAVDEFKLRDGKCELGWALIDDTCFTYVGSYVTYKEADFICKKFESRLARETVAPIKLPRFRKLARISQFEYETQSYRKIWLYSDSVFSLDLLTPNSKCSVIEDFGVSSTNCDDTLPFICEKDPVFTGAAFKFKDEIAFAIAAIGALLICIILLTLLWIYKSRKRKKEHIDRQNTLRNSARTNRHMISSGFSTLNSSKSNQKSNSNLYGNASFDNLSTGFRGGIHTASSRGVNGGIYNSQRNQYFANKKHKKKNEENSIDTLNNNENISPSASFNTVGLDSNQGSSYYGTNEKQLIIDESTHFNKSKINPSIQYHVFDANTITNNSTNKSSIKYGELEDVPNEDEDTTTDELTSEETTITKCDRTRFRIGKANSPGSSNFKTTITDFNSQTNNPEQLEKEFIQTKLVKTNISPIETKQSNNKFSSSYDHIMNATLVTDTEDDFLDGNSKRLLMNKVDSSTMKKNDFNSTSMLTNITPLTNVSFNNNNNQNQQSSSHNSDYENLSNSAINDILNNYPNKKETLNKPQVAPKRNIYTQNPSLLQLATAPRSKPKLPVTQPPIVPQVLPPQLYSQFKQVDDTNEDNESMMSCQLITSSSLLLNRDNIKEAKKITELNQEKFLVPPIRNLTQLNKPVLNPRNLVSIQSSQTDLPAKDANVQFTQTDSDVSKPPPMETAI